MCTRTSFHQRRFQASISLHLTYGVEFDRSHIVAETGGILPARVRRPVDFFGPPPRLGNGELVSGMSVEPFEYVALYSKILGRILLHRPVFQRPALLIFVDGIRKYIGEGDGASEASSIISRGT